MYRMVFVAPTPNKSHAAPRAWVLQPSTALPPVDLQAVALEDARVEAAGIWAGITHHRYMDPDGYWIVDDQVAMLEQDGQEGDDDAVAPGLNDLVRPMAGRIVAHDERDEVMTPRAPIDLARIAEFKRAMLAAGGGLVQRATLEEHEDPEFVEMLDDVDLTYDRDDFIDPADLILNERQQAAIALHPISRDQAQLDHTLAFMAGGVRADRGTVADLQEAWLIAANNLATMAQAGLLVSSSVVRPGMTQAA